MAEVEKIIRAIQARIDELLGDIERLRRALAHLAPTRSNAPATAPAWRRARRPATEYRAGEVTASRVLGLGRGPVRDDPLCGGIRLERDDQLDLGERDLQLSQGRYQPGAVEL